MKSFILCFYAMVLIFIAGTHQCWAAAKSSDKYRVKTITVQPKIETQKTINDLKEVAQKLLLAPYLEELNRCPSELLEAVEIGVIKAIEKNTEIKAKFLIQYKNIKQRMLRSESLDPKKLDEDGNSEWNEVIDKTIKTINGIYCSDLSQPCVIQ